MFFSTVSSSQSEPSDEGFLSLSDEKGNLRGFYLPGKTETKTEISGLTSRITITQNFQNPFAENVEAFYTFKLPDDAAIEDFTIQIGERTFKGENAAPFEQPQTDFRRRKIAVIEPNSEIKITVSYLKTLKISDISESTVREKSSAIDYGNGVQTVLSTATGITQINESRSLEKRGIVSSNGQRPTSNNFSVETKSVGVFRLIISAAQMFRIIFSIRIRIS